MKARGWAVVQNNEILVATVSPTRRAAIVNYLVAFTGAVVLASHSDDAIEVLWMSKGGGGFSTPSGYCPQIVEVEIRLSE